MNNSAPIVSAALRNEPSTTCVYTLSVVSTSLTPDQRLKYREQCAEFLTPAFDALYGQCIQTSSISKTAVGAAAFPSCPLSVHALVAGTIQNAQQRLAQLPEEGVT